MADNPLGNPREVSTLLAVMAALRTPETGCPWDLEQTFETIVPYTIEEAYEVADAIERNAMDDLCDELGDLLLQVVYHSQMATEEGLFEFDDVVEQVNTKLVRRHPHVFGDEEARTAGAVKGFWERIKDEERAQKHALPDANPDQPSSALDGVPASLPGLMRAAKLQKKAARVGFDWPVVSTVLDKVEEEVAELRAEIDAARNDAALEECGDLMFAIANVVRHLDADPETVLRAANAKFERRFRAVEVKLTDRGTSPSQSSLEEMDSLWDETKRDERSQT
jgi:ATP diphosphatase